MPNNTTHKVPSFMSLVQQRPKQISLTLWITSKQEAPESMLISSNAVQIGRFWFNDLDNVQVD